MQAKLSKQSDQIGRKTPAWGKQKPDARIPVKDVCKDHVRKDPGGLLQARKYRDREFFVHVGRSDGRGCRVDDDRRLSLIQNLHQRIGFPGPEAESSAACQDPNGIRQRKRCRKAEVLRVLFYRLPSSHCRLFQGRAPFTFFRRRRPRANAGRAGQSGCQGSPSPLSGDSCFSSVSGIHPASPGRISLGISDMQAAVFPGMEEIRQMRRN